MELLGEFFLEPSRPVRGNRGGAGLESRRCTVDRSDTGTTSRQARPRGVRARSAKRLYVYGIVRSCPTVEALGLIGVAGAPLAVVTKGGISALVSEYSGPIPIQVLRRNLEPHHKVLSTTMSHRTILPLTFGHVVPGPRAVERFLALHNGRIQSILELVDGCVEMALRISVQGDSPFAHIVRRYPELGASRDRIFHAADPGTGQTEGGIEPSRDEMISLGREFAACLAREREVQTARVLEGLDRWHRKARVRPPGSESVLTDVSLLVPREGRAALEDRIEQSAATYSTEYLFELKGPYPPHSFVEIDEGED